MSDKLFFDSIRYRYDIRVFFSIRYDIRASEKTFFLRNFRRIFRNFGEFSEFSENFLNFWRIFWISGEFSDFRRIFGICGEFSAEKHKINQYWDMMLEVRYDIFFDMLKSPIYRHSIISRYDKLIPDLAYASLHKCDYIHYKIRFGLQHLAKSAYPKNCPWLLVFARFFLGQNWISGLTVKFHLTVYPFLSTLQILWVHRWR